MEAEEAGHSGDSQSRSRKSLKELVDSIAIDCFRYFSFQSLDQVLSLDLREYRLLCQAHRLKLADQYYWSAQNAFDANRATLRKKNGHLVYPNVKKLFDYEKAQKEAGAVRSAKKSTLSPQAQRMKAYLEKREEDNVRNDS